MKRIIVCLALLSICVALPLRAQENWNPPSIDYKQDLEGKSLGELRMLRNTIYALHGYEFKEKELKDYFWSLPWYQHIRRAMEKSGKKYSDAMLSSEERQFIKRVSAKEAELSQKAKQLQRQGQRYTLDAVTNLRQFPKFTGDSRQMLEDNGFLVRPARHEQFFFIYDENDEQNIPNFITSDSVLQLYHLFFDFSLRHIEQ
jgi:Protein of unknown function (DUF3160)/YARHG domain